MIFDAILVILYYFELTNVEYLHLNRIFVDEATCAWPLSAWKSVMQLFQSLSYFIINNKKYQNSLVIYIL